MKKNKRVSAAHSPELELRPHSQWADVWRRLCRNKLALVGMIIVVVLVLVAVFADFIAPYDYAEQDFINCLSFPSREHLLGTDNFGRDILSRIIYGGRISLLVSLLGCAISLTTGCILGACAGYFGGATETIVMRIMDLLMAIPGTLLAVCISASLGSGVWQTALAVSLTGIAPATRMLRATVMSIREQEFVEASRAAGASDIRTIFIHIVPNCLAPLIVDTTLRLGTNILMISSLSFIGLGIQPPTPEWGSMLNAGRQYIRDFYPLITFPGIAIMLAMFGFNVFGDGLRDALDPKLKQ